jgi:transcriptional regulator with XRE-family HTH domain
MTAVMEQREQLRALRQRLGISQAKLSFALGLDRTRFSLWENGSGKLDEEAIARVAAFLSQQLSSVQSLAAHWRANG